METCLSSTVEISEMKKFPKKRTNQLHYYYSYYGTQQSVWDKIEIPT